MQGMRVFISFAQPVSTGWAAATGVLLGGFMCVFESVFEIFLVML